MYGIDENTKESNVTAPINPGIQDNCFLTDVQLAPLKADGQELIQLTWEDEFGGSLREILWPVDEADTKQRAEDFPRKHGRDNKEHGWIKGTEVTPEAAVIQAYELFSQRAKHIAMRYMDEQTLIDATSGAANYAEFAEAYVNLFTPSRVENVVVRLKVVLDKNNYSKLPNFPPFIESMNVPKDKSKLSINPQYDKVEKATANGQASDGGNWEETSDIESKPVF